VRTSWKIAMPPQTPSIQRKSTKSSRVAEQSVADAAAEEKARLWKIENREAIQGFNDYIEKNGLPLEKFRQF
jgi:post-segregation antitoxin (ccd killing protein)